LTRVIKIHEGKPDYREYIELREKASDKEDYDDAIKAEKETKRLTPIKKLRDKSGA
jgi:hypothetical protein